MPLFFVFIDEFLIFGGRSFTKSLDMEWRIACMLIACTTGWYLKMLILIKITVLSAISFAMSLVIVLLVYTLVFHLFHTVVKSEVCLGISATHWNYSVHYIISWHVLVIIWTHMLSTLSIDVSKVVSLILPLSFSICLLAPWLVGLAILKSIFFSLTDHCREGRLFQHVLLVDSVPMMVDIATSLLTIWMSWWWYKSCRRLAKGLNHRLGLTLESFESKNILLTVLISDSVSPLVQLLHALPMIK